MRRETTRCTWRTRSREMPTRRAQRPAASQRPGGGIRSLALVNRLTRRVHFIVCANVIGGCQGSTGPASAAPDGQPWGSRFPWITLRDMVTAEALLTDALGIERWRLIIGPSMGGMRAMEWAATYPDRVGAIALMGSTAATTAEQIAWGTPQVAAIEADPHFRGGDYYDAADGEGPHVGLGIARQIAHITYRSEGGTRHALWPPHSAGRPLRGDELPRAPRRKVAAAI